MPALTIEVTLCLPCLGGAMCITWMVAHRGKEGFPTEQLQGHFFLWTGCPR